MVESRCVQTALMFFIENFRHYITMQVNFEQIYHGRAGYLQKIPVERRQISRAETAREILYQDWNLSQILRTTVIHVYLFNYTEYTFVP